MNKEKLIKWIEEEIQSCNLINEYERELALIELLLKINRGYFE